MVDSALPQQSVFRPWAQTGARENATRRRINPRKRGIFPNCRRELVMVRLKWRGFSHCSAWHSRCRSRPGVSITTIGGLAAAALVAASLTSARPSDPDAAGEKTVVTVDESHGEYCVTARFRVARPREVVLAVLTDYDRIADFMPGVEKSVVVERGPRRALVEQELTSRMMMFRKRVRLLLEIVET